uniref:Uncharacterized protein n=1 Tax=Glossina austeni TaxID=7395 RepID=A0A1A9VVS4_GLOAU
MAIVRWWWHEACFGPIGSKMKIRNQLLKNLKFEVKSTSYQDVQELNGESVARDNGIIDFVIDLKNPYQPLETGPLKRKKNKKRNANHKIHDQEPKETESISNRVQRAERDANTLN